MGKKLCKKCGNELPEDWNHKLCEVCQEKRNSFIKKGLTIAGTVVGVAAFIAALANSTNSDDDEYDFDNDYAGDDEPIGEPETTMPHQPRYKVEFKAFKTGDWYTKTETDYVNSAHSVALCNNFGRAYRVTDTDTGSVLLEADEDDGAAELAAEYRKY